MKFKPFSRQIVEEKPKEVNIQGVSVPKELLRDYFEYEFYRKIDPQFAYRYLVSSNAYFQAEQLSKMSVKMLLDLVKPIKDDTWKHIGMVIVLIMLFFIVMAGIYIFFFQGGTGGGAAVTPPKPPLPIKIG
jgi:hypothetical protein